MACLKDEYLMCNLPDKFVIGMTFGLCDNMVLLSQSNNRFREYNIVDQKLVHDWSAKTDHQLTCAAVSFSQDSLSSYAVITDQKYVRSWKSDDMQFDSSHKMKLAKPAHHLFSVKGDRLILYCDGSLGTVDQVLVNDNSEQMELVWCNVCHSDQHSTTWVVAVTTCQEANQLSVRTYTVNEDLSSAQLVKSTISLDKEDRPATFCLQSVEDDIYLVSLGINGSLSRTCLNKFSDQQNVEQLRSLPVSNASSCRQSLAVTAIDSTQFAVVSQETKEDPKLGVGIWDSKFGIFHSWRALPDDKHSNIIYVAPGSSHILVPCAGGIYVFPVIVKQSSLSTCIGKVTSTKTEVDISPAVKHALHQIANSSETPNVASFSRSFAVIREWLTSCGEEQKLKAVPLINAVVTRCISETRFWPVVELMDLVKTNVISSSVCNRLFSALSSHQELDKLLYCVEHIRHVPESALVIALSSFLSAPDDKFSSIQGVEEVTDSVDADADTVDGILDDVNKPVFSQQKSFCINRVLSLKYTSFVLLDSLHQLQYTQVLDLFRHLEYLMNTTSASCSSSSNRPNLAQVLDWLSLLIDSHYPQLALSTDTAQLHKRLQKALTLQRTDIETMESIDQDLARILRGVKQTGKTNVGSYCITVLRMV